MSFREVSSQRFLLAPATTWHCTAQCKRTPPSQEGQFTNACAVWTT
jgi:hypothetical protein